MSEKFSTCNSYPASPSRSNTFVGRGSTNRSITSKRNGVKMTGGKIIEEKKMELKNYRERRDEFGTNGLNLTLIGSPAPRSQVRALVSSTNLATKSKVKQSYNSKSREHNSHEMCMEKLYQFADNPTKFVRSQSHNEDELKLDLAFSERSDESENYYNSHNIAFGENGEYRIPEYDHIRFLQFSVGETQDLRANGDRDNSESIKSDHSIITSTGSTNTANRNEALNDNLVREHYVSTIPDGTETPLSLHPDGSIDLSESALRTGEFHPWTSKTNHTLNWSNSPVVDTTQNYPLGSAINYKKNINPEVEKFMLDTGPESLDENYSKSTPNNHLLDESILSKNFTQAMQHQAFQEPLRTSSQTSPETSRTTLSQASSSNGTWHGHSLNSPYFASKESNSQSDSNKNFERNSSKTASMNYEEKDEYLTIVKNEEDSEELKSEKGVGAHEYIFITDQFLDCELNNPNDVEGLSGPRYNADKPEALMVHSSLREFSHDSVAKVDGTTSVAIDKSKEDVRTISGSESMSDYCIRKIFCRSSSSSSSSPLSSSSSSLLSSSISSSKKALQSMKTEICASNVLLGDKIKVRDNKDSTDTAKFSVPEVEELNTLQQSLNSNVLYITVEEMNLAADYTNKLSEIFDRVLKRSENKDHVQSVKKLNFN